MRDQERDLGVDVEEAVQEPRDPSPVRSPQEPVEAEAPFPQKLAEAEVQLPQ